ncbi:hydroxymethylglutaryl-CoA synthase family protein [Rubrivivax rivuli]|uniref:Hydroxymethylglutaryl-CoA synthase family protein n=1 Tax=Rubrivivax rivuli TaxID=1862385 RepID=A0A437RE58_9BURK|nr:hydroxymethylglutaryl-CoA synthase [Rubrivivax rivuli]RVU45047.1 hydroxymethylglutaryl-CoA synthase family protein [Rubrivivax rivuli]
MTDHGPIGIDRIGIDPGTLSLDMAALVAARGGDVGTVCGDMMIDQRSLLPPWEDPVTLAVNAAEPVLAGEDRGAVKLLLVASESAPDQEKALSTWVQRHLGLADDCRNLEVKHACYGGTGALHLALAWLAAEAQPGEKALVVCTDQSRAHFGQPYEFVMGAGAAALLLSHEPRFLAIDRGLSGLYTHEVSDLIRPTSRVEAGHSETSLLSYMDAVDTAFERYAVKLQARRGVGLGSLAALQQWLPFQIYHAPFGGITRRAHRAVLRSVPGWQAGALAADYADRVEPSLVFNRRMGGTYAASVFISLAGLAWQAGDSVNGRRVGIYSYGSGSTGEFYSGVFGPQAASIAQQAQVRERLDARLAASVAEYEEAETRRSAQIDEGDFDVATSGLRGLWHSHYAGRGRLVFEGARGHVRRYGRS